MHMEFTHILTREGRGARKPKYNSLVEHFTVCWVSDKAQSRSTRLWEWTRDRVKRLPSKVATQPDDCNAGPTSAAR